MGWGGLPLLLGDLGLDGLHAAGDVPRALVLAALRLRVPAGLFLGGVACVFVVAARGFLAFALGPCSSGPSSSRFRLPLGRHRDHLRSSRSHLDNLFDATCRRAGVARIHRPVGCPSEASQSPRHRTGVIPVKYPVVILAALVLVLGTVALGRADAPAGVPRWEYRLVAVVGPEVEGVRKEMEGLMAAADEHMRKLGYETVEYREVRKFLTEAWRRDGRSSPTRSACGSPNGP